MTRVWPTALGLASVLVASWVAAQGITGDRRSGYQDMGAALQRMQDDDGANPGMLYVQLGGRLWREPAGREGKACDGCHGIEDMKGVALRYPAMPARGDTPIDLEGRINLCRTGQQGAARLADESQELLALTAYVAHQSRGQPIAPPDDARLAPSREQGEALFRRRQGQLNLSCAACHDDNAGRRLAGVAIPQGHPTGYPIYRLEWQGLGSLKRRLRNCLVGIRAEPPAYDSPQYVALELYLMERARGLLLETPAVRP
jgi:sulfur-oxidizing protein SoxA